MALQKTALLLIAHGSRQEEANADLYHMVAEMKKLGGYELVEASFLEMAEPGVEEGGKRCVQQGAHLVILLPYFLSAGIHVRRDLVGLRRKLEEQFPGTRFRLAEPLGRHPLLLEVVADRARQAASLDGQ